GKERARRLRSGAESWDRPGVQGGDPRGGRAEPADEADEPRPARPAVPRSARLAVVVAALGYLVDIYDLILFSVVRIPSLRAIGVGPESIDLVGQKLLNWQMTGMLVGGVLWGILG